MNKASLYTAALIALGVVSQASAVNTVYLTGSTAFRSTVYNALHASSVFDSGVVTFEATEGNSTPSKCNYMLFEGSVSNTVTYINCSWSGSFAGLACVQNVVIDNDGAALFGSPAYFLKTDGTVPAGNNSATPVVGGLLESSSRQADLTFCDASDNSALTAIQPSLVSNPPKSYGVLGVVTFVYCKNYQGTAAATANTADYQAWSHISNISTYQSQVMFQGGVVTADFLSGVTNDVNTHVYLVGRNKGSGTRANFLNDNTYGLNNAGIQFNIGGGLTTAPSGALVLDVNGGSSSADEGISQDDGYESGGNVAKALSVAGSTIQADPIFSVTNGWCAIGYLGCSDANSANLTPSNGTWLSENGVAESNAAIETGAYSFWGYENVYGRHNLVTGSYQDVVAHNVVRGTISQINVLGYGTVPANHDPAIPVALMNAQKLSDFAYPTHL